MEECSFALCQVGDLISATCGAGSDVMRKRSSALAEVKICAVGIDAMAEVLIHYYRISPAHYTVMTHP